MNSWSVSGRLVLWAGIFLLAVSATLRVSLYWMLPEYFAVLDGLEVIKALGLGLRYDLALLLLVLSPPCILVSFPGSGGYSRWLRYVGYWLLALLLAISVILGIASLQFFTFFNRHLGVEIQALFSDFDFILQLAVEQHSLALFTVLFALMLALYLSSRWLPKIPAPATSSKAYSLRLSVILLLALIAIYQPLARQWTNNSLAFDITDANSQAERYRQSRFGQLVLNPAYEAYRGLLFPPRMPATKGKPIAALETEMINTANSVDSRNIVLVILESWTPDFMGAYGAQKSVTPEFDKIAATGRVFDQAYANGPISIYGLQALLTGVAHLPGMPLMGAGGVETTATEGLATGLASQGYETFWVQAPRRASFNMDWLAARWGYQHIAGKEQFHTPESWVSTPFGWDWPMYEYSLSKIPKLKPPFFATLYTAVTHIPYVEVPAVHRVAEHDAENVGGYMNTLSRADWALGRFWQQAKQQPWHNNTVYVFVSDHVVPKFMPDKSVRGRFRIPLVVVGAGVQPGKDTRLMSQIDVLPLLNQLSDSQEAKVGGQGVIVSNAPTNYWIDSQRVIAGINELPTFIEAGSRSDVAEAQFQKQLQAAYWQYQQAELKGQRQD